LGKLVAERRETHPEEPTESILVASKFLPFPTKLFYPDCLLASLRASLERCKVKSFDLYQIHGPVHLRSIEVVADALAVAYKEGLIKTVGVSNYSISEMTRMHKALKSHGIQLASNQVEFSLLRRLPETSGLIKAAHELGVAIMAYSPLGMGKLTGKYSSQNPPDNFRGRFGRVPLDKIGKLMDTLNDVAKKYEKSASQIALNWIICKGAIPIPGAKNARQAESNAKCIGWRLSDEDVQLLDSVAFEGTNTFIWQHG
jgi:aryl-alcohol dehydrogenase-like predicted oxidoreductase